MAVMAACAITGCHRFSHLGGRYGTGPAGALLALPGRGDEMAPALR
jgi:hypothetical protein